VPDTTQPDPPLPGEGEQTVQIRTFLIADVRGYTLFTQERGDEAAAKLADEMFVDAQCWVVVMHGGRCADCSTC
jgi:class 3 adenylate cyclase